MPSRHDDVHLLTDGKSIYLEESPNRIIDLLKNARQPMFLVCVSDQVRRLTAPPPERKARAQRNRGGRAQSPRRVEAWYDPRTTFAVIALSISGAIESSHMGHPDFRTSGKIFATLGPPGKVWAMVKLTPGQQRDFVAEAPEVFVPGKRRVGAVAGARMCNSMRWMRRRWKARSCARSATCLEPPRRHGSAPRGGS